MKKSVAPKRSIRELPYWEVQGLLKARRLTQTDIARRTGIADALISKTIRNEGQVAPATRDRIWRAIEEAIQ